MAARALLVERAHHGHYYRLLPVITGKEGLKQLGLGPGQPITLKELLEWAKALSDPLPAPWGAGVTDV